MSTPATTASPALSRPTWAPLIVIVLAQVMMVFNISTLQVSMEAIAASFRAAATTIGAAIITYSLVVAALILPGARVAQMLGARRVFRTAVLLFGAGMALMALSPGVIVMLAAQAVAGVAAAAIVPTLVVLIANNYQGDQQAKALGWLGGAPAMGVVLAFLLAGSLTTWIGWRFMFGALAAMSVGLFKLSDRFTAARGVSPSVIDVTGAVLAALAILLISVGSSNLNGWGVLLASPSAPFSVLDMSPAPLMILAGIFLLQAFISWSRRRRDAGQTTLVSLDVIDSSAERAALFSILIISALASAITFLIPLYLQVVQGRTSLDTAMTVIPFSIASFLAAVLIVRLYDRVSPHRIARHCFLLVAAGLTLLGATIRNDWSNGMVVFGMIVAGLGEGALATLLFNVLVTASPKNLAADVGSARGVTNNLASAIGTALAGALLIGLLDSSVHHNLAHNPRIPYSLRREVNLDDVQFISNARLREVLADTSASAAQVEEALRINTEARLLSLKLTFFAFAGLAILAYFPAGALPSYVRRELPRGVSQTAPDPQRTAASSTA